jgi:hypothetical protein
VFLGRRQPVTVLLAVPEAQRVLGLDLDGELLLGSRVEETVQAVARPDAQVVAALRAHLQVALELGAVEDRVAGRALDPQAFRDGSHAALRLDA